MERPFSPAGRVTTDPAVGPRRPTRRSLRKNCLLGRHKLAGEKSD